MYRQCKYWVNVSVSLPLSRDFFNFELTCGIVLAYLFGEIGIIISCSETEIPAFGPLIMMW